MRSVVILFLFVSCVLLTVAACGGSGGDTSEPEGNGEAQPTESGGDVGGAAGARVIDVEATFYQFDPGEIIIRVGEPVQFRAINPNGGIHTFTIADLGLEVDLRQRPMMTAISDVFVATSVGRYPITCRVHDIGRYPDMIGELVVGE